MSDIAMREIMKLKRKPFVRRFKKSVFRRNAPCVCGSGKKFKKCCIDKVKANNVEGMGR